MAKKVAETLKKEGGRNFAKVIRAIKNPDTGAYTFKEEMVPLDQVQSVIKK